MKVTFIDLPTKPPRRPLRVIGDPTLNQATSSSPPWVAREILRRQGTSPWNKSQGCWGPKLVALGYNPDGKGSGVRSPRVEEVIAENGEWSQPVKNDRQFEKVRWYPNKPEGCEVRADEDDSKVFGCDQVLDLKAVPTTFNFRHKGKERMTVEIRFTNPFNR
jgi:hypothetical protein